MRVVAWIIAVGGFAFGQFATRQSDTIMILSLVDLLLGYAASFALLGILLFF